MIKPLLRSSSTMTAVRRRRRQYSRPGGISRPETQLLRPRRTQCGAGSACFGWQHVSMSFQTLTAAGRLQLTRQLKRSLMQKWPVGQPQGGLPPKPPCARELSLLRSTHHPHASSAVRRRAPIAKASFPKLTSVGRSCGNRRASYAVKGAFVTVHWRKPVNDLSRSLHVAFA